MCDRLLASVGSAAAALDLSESTIRRMVAAGELTSIEVRGKLRIHWAALRAVAADRGDPPTDR